MVLLALVATNEREEAAWLRDSRSHDRVIRKRGMRKEEASLVNNEGIHQPDDSIILPSEGIVYNISLD